MNGSTPASEIDAVGEAGHLRVQIQKFGSPQRAASEREYLKSQLRHLGAPVPAVRGVVRAWVRGHPSLSSADLFAVADVLWAEPVHESRLAAIELLSAVPSLVAPADLPWIERHLRECHTWALVDPLAGVVVADLVARRPEVLEVIDGWVADDDFWIRRSAVLALRSVLRRGEQLDRLFAYAEQLLPDTEFFVRKVLGWVLREVAPRHSREVSAWLRDHMDDMNLVTLREPLRKLADADDLRERYDNRRKRSG